MPSRRSTRHKRRSSRRKRRSSRRKRRSTRHKRRSSRRKRRSSHRKIIYKKKSGNCIARSDLSLRADQKKVVRHLDKHEQLLVVHGTGCGKTLSAVAISQCFLDAHPTYNVVFVGPASLLDNFKKEMIAYGSNDFRQYKFFSFQKFFRRCISCKKTLLIIDEAHNLRNLKTKMYKGVIKCAQKAKKRLLLTATPYVNTIKDFASLINVLYGQDDLIGYTFKKNNIDYKYWIKGLTSSKLVISLLKGNVDYIPTCSSGIHYPKVTENFMEIPMTLAYQDRYSLTARYYPNPQKFYHGYRKAVNEAGANYYSQKINTIFKHIKTQKSVIYTNWLTHGVRILETLLDKNKIKYKSFQGSLNRKQRKEILEDFNNNKFQVLIITAAGGEGLDLKGVKNLIVLEPVWNNAKLRQIIGRVARYKSHTHLPKKNRHVNVYKLVLVPHNSKFNIKKTISKDNKLKTGDTLLYEIIERKSKEEIIIDKILKQASI